MNEYVDFSAYKMPASINVCGEAKYFSNIYNNHEKSIYQGLYKISDNILQFSS